MDFTLNDEQRQIYDYGAQLAQKFDNAYWLDHARRHTFPKEMFQQIAEDGFLGINANRDANPDNWRLSFPSLSAYRDEWLRQAQDFQTQQFAENPRDAIFATTTLEEIEVEGETALVRKKFAGGLRKADGSFDVMKWQTLYYCRLHQGRWKIGGLARCMPEAIS